nr:molybdopterin molybdotransferase MoeA [Desulfopila inferna]
MALKVIRDHLPVLRSENILLNQALGRVCSASLYASESYPSFSQSNRDGYAVGKTPFGKTKDGLEYRLDAEIAAGDIQIRRNRPGFAHRIMTGAPVPRGVWKVIPQEMCRERKGGVFIAEQTLLAAASHIQKRGSSLRRGALLLRDGACLGPAHLARLADSGYVQLQVYQRPKVAFFCTGSELVDNPARQSRGQKISSNRYLLAALIHGFGGRGDDCGAVRDQREALEKHLTRVEDGNSDIIISTGGMGPGRYDLMEETFTRCGGKIIFSSLKLRPGKSVLFGIIGNSLYFGLPGPPQAVQALFHVLIRPALLAMQGLVQWKTAARAYLKEEMMVRKPGVLKLQEAVLSEERGVVMVRPAGGKETGNCYLFCPAARKRLKKDELATVLPLTPPSFLSS